MREETGANVEAPDRAEYERNIAADRAQLGEAAFEQARAEGHALSMEQAVAFAFEEAVEKLLI